MGDLFDSESRQWSRSQLAMNQGGISTWPGCERKGESPNQEGTGGKRCFSQAFYLGEKHTHVLWPLRCPRHTARTNNARRGLGVQLRGRVCAAGSGHWEWRPVLCNPHTQESAAGAFEVQGPRLGYMRPGLKSKAKQNQNSRSLELFETRRANKHFLGLKRYNCLAQSLLRKVIMDSIYGAGKVQVSCVNSFLLR